MSAAEQPDQRTLASVDAVVNEALFREVNERIVELGDAPASEELSFVCECASIHCTEHLPMTVDEYRRIRAHPAQFAVKPGHEADDLERIVSTTDRYEIVEKFGSAGALAERLA